MRVAKSPLRRLAVWMVVITLVGTGLLVAVAFAAPGLLARKAARRITVVEGALLVDGKPVAGTVELFETNTFSSHVTQRQLRMAFRGAAGTLEGRIGRPPVVVVETDEEGWQRLCAYWELAGGYVELMTGSGNDADWTHLRAVAGTRPAGAAQRPAVIEDVTRIYAR